jgi:hypothetical protein
LNAAFLSNAVERFRPPRLASLVRFWIDQSALRFRVAQSLLIWRRCIKR